MSIGNGLPEGWAKAKIGELIGFHETANPSTSALEVFQYVDIQAIDNVAGMISSPKSLACSRAPSRARNVIRSGDVLISLVRPYLRNIAVVPESLHEQWASTAFCVCRPRLGVESRYLYYYFRQDSFIRAIPTYGDSPPAGHDEDLLSTELDLPPSGEQERIADRIDELFTNLAAGVAALERVQKKLKRYRAAVLHAAVTGRLTEAWRKQHGRAIQEEGAEPGDKLLERLLVERRRQWEARTLADYEQKGKQPPKNWRERYKEPVEPETADLSQLPEGWCWASVEQLGWVQLGRQRSPKNRSNKFPTLYLRAANLTESGIDLSSLLDMEFTPGEMERYQLRYGDILLSEASGSPNQVGKPVVWRDELPACAFQNTVIRLRTTMSPDYLLTFFQYCYTNQAFARMATGVGINHLSANKFSQLSVSITSVDEQDAIVGLVQEKLSQIDSMEAEVERGLARAARLRQAILKSAFAGELIPQDPNDEPASVLLERIRTERETPTNHSNGRPKRVIKKKSAKKARKS